MWTPSTFPHHMLEFEEVSFLRFWDCLQKNLQPGSKHLIWNAHYCKTSIQGRFAPWNMSSISSSANNLRGAVWERQGQFNKSPQARFHLPFGAFTHYRVNPSLKLKCENCLQTRFEGMRGSLILSKKFRKLGFLPREGFQSLLIPESSFISESSLVTSKFQLSSAILNFDCTWRALRTTCFCQKIRFKSTLGRNHFSIAVPPAPLLQKNSKLHNLVWQPINNLLAHST